MGGNGSGRWGMTVTRMTTEGLPRLDVRALARAGALHPATTSSIVWSAGVSIEMDVTCGDPDALTLRYVVRTHNGVRASVTERVGLTATPCTFGGSRVWFLCPGCGNRCAVLYAFSVRFRCRTCHHLAYDSTRH